jgi:hypothetical protein
MGDTSFSPHSFGGTVSEDADERFRHYIRYVEYRELTDARKLALFKVLLKGTTGDWLDTLAAEITNDYEQLMAACNARYQNPVKERYKSAKYLFTLKQKPEQATGVYVAHKKLNKRWWVI